MTSTLEQTNEELILSFLADSGDEYTSGEALSGKLGLSRAAVWKHVEALRTKGYRIEAAPARGYRLLEVPDRLTPLELSPLLNTHDLGRTIHFEESVGSTNEVAYHLAAEGAFHGELVICEQQLAGKGRRGRSWVSPPGVNLYCSLVLRPDLPPFRASELTLVASVALAETIGATGVQPAIKWPNDLLAGGKKVAGILTELSADTERVHFVILGMGVNLNVTGDQLGAELASSATSVALERGERVPRALFAAALLSNLETWLDRHAEKGFAPVKEAWRAYTCTLGQEILVKTDRRELRGVASDIDDDGALLVRTVDGVEERVLAGDVEQVRPRVARRE